MSRPGASAPGHFSAVPVLDRSDASEKPPSDARTVTRHEPIFPTRFGTSQALARPNKRAITRPSARVIPVVNCDGKRLTGFGAAAKAVKRANGRR